MKSTTVFDVEALGPRSVVLEGGEAWILSRRGPGKSVNEDSAAIIPYPGGVVLAVCDGMGGHRAGERASRAAIEALMTTLGETRDELEPRHALVDGIEAANRAVLDLGLGAGATLAAALVRDHRVRSAHVGDAAFLHMGQRGRVHSETLSHTPTSYLVEAGSLDEEQALHHADRHVVSNYLGNEAMRIDLGPALPLARRDTLLLASDGLFDNLWRDEILERTRRGALGSIIGDLAEQAGNRMRSPPKSGPSKPDDLAIIVYRRTQ